MFDYVKTLNIESDLLQNFLKQFYDYQVLIVFLLTFIVVIFHYQMVHRKKIEVYCRILVGDTIQLYFAIEKCREMQLKMQRFATHLIPFRQCVGQSIALAMKRDDMGVMN